ncbi:ascorbate peroxidase [Klebsormidium nitens]|uniref:Ascorbate peroxidase n=1 Tax=Klebsormidium nitens TaxID=105231 RepID=A0A1Y1HNY6_KLENI|nr:ascorbate peroxidase [Klebsormidium nitens]|eukprot:GAQ78691.1 ascorbate peroxidase [Klebsormidium nitens]
MKGRRFLLFVVFCFVALSPFLNNIEARQDPTWEASKKELNGGPEERRMLSQIQPRDDQDALRQVAFSVFQDYVQCNKNAGNMLRLAFHGQSVLKFNFGIVEAAREDINRLSGLPSISYADVIQLGGAFAVETCGGPSIPLTLGRVDASGPDIVSNLPGIARNTSLLQDYFNASGYDTAELVAMMGGHTLGISRGFQPLGRLDPTPEVFDNAYFQMLLQGGGSFGVDQCLMDDQKFASIVATYAENQSQFFEDFVSAYVKMSLLGIS